MSDASSLPKVSIVTPSYNSAQIIESCIKSIAQQTYPNKEHLIIDACSKDDTIKIVENYLALYPHIRLISEPDKGIWDAMNKGIDRATGEWLIFMGGDDALYNSEVLSNIFKHENVVDYDIIYGNIKHRQAGKVFDNEFNTKLLARFNIAHQAIFYRKAIFEITGKFDLKYFSGSDYAVNIKWFGNKKVRRKYIKDVVCIYNEDGLSSLYFDSVFNREKAGLLLKYLEFENAEDFTDAVRHTIYTQLKNNDIRGAFGNLGILFKHAGASFNKWLFIKEFLALIFKKMMAWQGKNLKAHIKSGNNYNTTEYYN